jgi:hypothetical protein
MEATITVQKIEAKTTKAGLPMWTITTNAFKLSLFDKAIADSLLIGQSYVVEIEEKNGYKNLMKLIGKANFTQASSFQPQVQHQPLSREEQIKQKRFDSASFAISYAVRLAEAGKLEVKDISAKSKELLALYEEMLEANLVPEQKVK